MDPKERERIRWPFGYSLAILLCGVALLMRAYNAFVFPGFYSGDDVEVLELALSRLQGWRYAPWDLRCPLYPLGIIYPVVWLAERLGLLETGALIAVARLFVAAVSALAVFPAYRLAHRLSGSQCAGALAAAVVTVSWPLARFGGTVLPRPIAATLVLAAAAWLVGRKEGSGGRLAAAASALGLAAALRFSEAVALAGAAMGRIIVGHRREAMLLAAGGTAIMAALVGGADAMFWGNPLHSTRAIVHYTLIEHASTRGVQPWHAYVGLLARAMTPLGLPLLAAAVRRRYAELWAWALGPVVLLSMLPHKELRYLIPVLPLFEVLAGLGAWELLRGCEDRLRGDHWGYVLFVLFMLLNFAMMPFRKPSDPVVAARWLASHLGHGTVVLEQAWRAGDRLYLPRTLALVNLEPGEIQDEPEKVLELAARPDVVAVGLRTRTARRLGLAHRLIARGFREITLSSVDNPPTYRLFVR